MLLRLFRVMCPVGCGESIFIGCIGGGMHLSRTGILHWMIRRAKVVGYQLGH
jgi:hypothetical protein